MVGACIRRAIDEPPREGINGMRTAPHGAARKDRVRLVFAPTSDTPRPRTCPPSRRSITTPSSTPSPASGTSPAPRGTRPRGRCLGRGIYPGSSPSGTGRAGNRSSAPRGANAGTRAAYDITCEVSVYIADDAKGQGVGRALYTDLFARLKAIGYRHIIGGISLPNRASVRLHESWA